MSAQRRTGFFSLGVPALDLRLAGGLELGMVHEFLADPGDNGVAGALCLCLTRRALSPGGHTVWIRLEAGQAEGGAVYGPGLAGLGFDPTHLTLVTLRSTIDLLRAGIEAARCPAVGAVILDMPDGGRHADLTATRRLVLAAEVSGVTVFLTRVASIAPASAARTRWRVRPARSGVPTGYGIGRAAFAIELLRHRGGMATMCGHVEWDHEHGMFEAVSEPVVSLSSGRPLAA